MTTMSVRLNYEENSHILKWAKQQKKDKSQAVRDLLEYGWKFALLERYQKGKISLGFLAKEIGCSFSEAMDFVTDHSVHAKIDSQDYLTSLENSRQLL